MDNVDNLTQEATKGFVRTSLMNATDYVVDFRRKIDQAEEDLDTLKVLVDKLPKQNADKGYVTKTQDRLDALITRYNRAFDAALKAEEIHDDTPDKDALSERLEKSMSEDMSNVESEMSLIESEIGYDNTLILGDAEDIRLANQRRSVYANWASVFLYALGSGLGLAGKLYGGEPPVAVA